MASIFIRVPGMISLATIESRSVEYTSPAAGFGRDPVASDAVCADTYTPFTPRAGCGSACPLGWRRHRRPA